MYIFFDKAVVEDTCPKVKDIYQKLCGQRPYTIIETLNTDTMCI